MGLQLGGGHGDGDGRGTTLRLSAGGGGLPPGVLGPGDALHDGEGAGGIYAQPRRDVQPPHQVWCLRREAGPRLRPHRHGPLCADGVDRRAQMAHDESRPREGPDRLPGSNTPMATEEGALPHRPLHEGRGEAGRRARASDQRPPQGLAGYLLPGQHRLQRVCAPLSRRAARRYHRARDGAHYRTAQGSVVSYHRTAEGPRTGRRTVVCHPQGRGAEHPLRLPRLRPGDGL